MRASQFGMNRRPFGGTADMEAFFASAASEAVFAALDDARERGEAGVLVDGPAGVGKTFTALAWLDRLRPFVPRVWLPNIHAARPVDLLQAILFDLDLPYEGKTEQELRLAVTAQLLTSLHGGQATVLVIDEAQHLSAAALEELRLLGNIENRHGKGLFTVLVAQPGLRERLEQPECAAFASRLAPRCELLPLTDAESREYLEHALRFAGGTADELMGEEAFELLAASCGGLPRVLNRAASLAFDIAEDGEAESIDAEAVLEALERLGLEPVEAERPSLIAHPSRLEQAEEPARSPGPGEGVLGKGHDATTGSSPKQKSSRRRSA